MINAETLQTSSVQEYGDMNFDLWDTNTQAIPKNKPTGGPQPPILGASGIFIVSNGLNQLAIAS